MKYGIYTNILSHLFYAGPLIWGLLNWLFILVLDVPMMFVSNFSDNVSNTLFCYFSFYKTPLQFELNIVST